MKWIKLPIEVMCCHEDGKNSVEMDVTVDDPEVPTYLATCPKCGKVIIIAFGDFLHEEKPQ